MVRTRHTVQPLVYIILVTFNGRSHLTRLFPSLRRTIYPNFRVVLVDNASTDGSAEYAAREWPGIEVIRNDRNEGFAPANNTAIVAALAAGAAYVMLLNDDTEILDPTWLDAAVEVLEQDQQIGMVGFDIHDSSTEQTPMTKELVIHRETQLVGCALLVRAALLEGVGSFDPVYFAYSEEDDLEARAMHAGYLLVRINRPIYHYGGGTSGKRARWTAYMVARNAIRCSLKNRSLFRTLARVARLFDVACNPWPLFLDPADSAHRRIRNSGNLFLNFFLISGACAWNLFFLPQTLAIRRRDRHRAVAARRYLARAAR